MPCRDYESADEANARLVNTINKRTVMLCGVMRELEAIGDLGAKVIRKLPSETRRWWAEHKRRDAEAQEERKLESVRASLRLQGLKKLTKEEREALGVKE